MLNSKQINQEIIQYCQMFANKMRLDMLELSRIAQTSVHWGGAFSCAEILAVLFTQILNINNKMLNAIEKDKFILSKGHASIALYTVMHRLGMLTDDQIQTYQQNGSKLAELVEYNKDLGFESSGGSLGINLSYAVGLTLLAKRKNYNYKVYIVVGDGELDEGSMWESIMSASQFKLDNLIMIVDANKIQSDGYTRDIMRWDNLDKQLESFGWNTISVDGHNCSELIDAIINHNKNNMPKAIIANTIKGKGVSFMEDNYVWHDWSLTQEEFELAINEVKKACLN